MPAITATLNEIRAGRVMLGPCVAALGAFDGVHCGHVQLLEQAKQLAGELGASHVAFTFDCLPLELLRPQAAPPLLTPHPKRIALLSTYVDMVVVTVFGHELAELTPEQFVSDVLIKGLGCVGVVAGFTHTFGKDAAGNTALLADIGARHGLHVRIVPPVHCDGRQVSSTLIRQLLTAGDVSTAAVMLGREYALEGQVVAGDARGRLLGFPTANIQSDPRLLVPAEGVYISDVWRGRATDGMQQRVGAAVTAISNRPTFSGTDISVESHILDYQSDLYGALVSVRFLRRIRDITHFAGPDELQAQIQSDVSTTRTHFSAFTRVGQSGKLVR